MRACARVCERESKNPTVSGYLECLLTLSRLRDIFQKKAVVYQTAKSVLHTCVQYLLVAFVYFQTVSSTTIFYSNLSQKSFLIRQ